jgi:uncharacterized membrane protein YhiD involved in acid resistance
MDEMLKELTQFGDLTSSFTLLDVAAVFGLAFALTLLTGWVYKFTHRGVSYSQTYVHTLVILGITVAFIMLIIGSNIARAFTLVGALSIIRFRNAIKEPRDIAFLFMVMSVGMACGTRFYSLAVFATICLNGAMILMTKLGMFAKVIRERILIVRLPAGAKAEETFQEVFGRSLDEFHVISLETVQAGSLQELVYSVVLKRRVEPNVFLEDLRRVNGNNKVSLVLGQQEIDL